MADKNNPELVADVAHHDKETLEARQPSVAESGGRRISVALNIVENPLKVSCALARQVFADMSSD